MNTQILYCKDLIAKEYELIRNEIKQLNSKAPKLCIIQIGDNPSSNIYIKNKQNACRQIGADFSLIKLPADTTFEVFKGHLNRLNCDDSVDGYLVQLPTNPIIQSNNWTALIDPLKDVDGFHPQNIYNLYQNKNLETTLLPCTPQGVLFLLDQYNIEYAGKTVCIAGRSLIVGKPLELLFQASNATTILCHSKTKNIEELINASDIFVSAVGIPRFFNKDHFNKDNLTIVDVGINMDQNNKLCGDVDFAGLTGKIQAISPVPGGVGPLTVLFLIKNLIKTWKIRNHL